MSSGLLPVLNEDAATGEPDVIRHAAATGNIFPGLEIP